MASLARLPEGLLRRMGLEPGERGPAFVMAALVATLLCAYTIAKVLRDSLFLSYFGPLALPWAYVAVAFASLLFVWLEHRIGSRLPFGATRYTQFLAIAFSIVAPLVWHRDRMLIAGAFYIWTGSQTMMLLPHFWVLALDLWDTRRARRVFPVLAGFGLIGGLTGGAISRWFTRWGTTGLMWTLVVLLFVALGLTRLAERHRRRRPNAPSPAAATSSWSLFRNSRYLQLLIAVLTLSVVVSTLVDFQFKTYIQHLYPEPHAMTRFLGAFYIGLNLLALLFQFGMAGWLLERLNLGLSSTLQPVTLLGFATLAAFANGGWAVVALRWIQGIVQQGIGKSSIEIYFGAIRPQERRRIKPAVDTLVERWADALVGLLLIVALTVFRVPLGIIGTGTAVLCAVWIGLMLALNRQYGRAFENALSHRWIATDDAPETLRSPLARRALLRALQDGDPPHIALALRLARNLRGPQVTRAVREGLLHPSPVVRVAAIETMEGMRLDDRERRVEAALDDTNDAVRSAAVSYLVSRPRLDEAILHRLLDGEDPVLRLHVVDALIEHPGRALDLLTPAWIEKQLATDRPEHLIAAARALGVHRGPFADGALRRLISHPDSEVRRAALDAATSRPHPHLLPDLLPLLEVPELAFAARRAVAANGDAAVRPMRDLLAAPRRRALAAHTLAQIGTPRAISALLPLARSSDAATRTVGLEALLRARMAIGRPVLGRAQALRFLLRELHDYEEASAPARGLASAAAPELQLLGDSWGELADHAIDRAFWALACSYEPRPLFGAFARLKSRDPATASPALEYLGHVLPRAVFRTLGRVFDLQTALEATPEAVHRWITAAWNSGDDWLRACAVRAATAVPGFDVRLFATGDPGDPHVREEIEALARRGRMAPARIREATGC